MSNAADRVTSYVLEAATKVAVAQRIQIYRDTATVIADTQCAKLLRELANELERIEEQHQQLLLDFQRRAEG